MVAGHRVQFSRSVTSQPQPPRRIPPTALHGPKGFGRHASRPGGGVETGKGADHERRGDPLASVHERAPTYWVGFTQAVFAMFLLMTSTSWWCVLSPCIAVPASTFRPCGTVLAA